MTIIAQNNKLFILVRTIKKNVFTELSDVKIYQEYIHAEHTLQDAEQYMFCKTIDDIEVIEEN